MSSLKLTVSGEAELNDEEERQHGVYDGDDAEIHD